MHLSFVHLLVAVLEEDRRRQAAYLPDLLDPDTGEPLRSPPPPPASRPARPGLRAIARPLAALRLTRTAPGTRL